MPCRNMVRQQWLLVACLLLMEMVPVATGAPIATIRYHQNGQVTTCIIATCRKGYETVQCTVNGSMDTCSLCPPDKYQPVDNITSDLHLPCSQVHCAPDNQRQVHRGKPGPGNPPVCECDTSRNYYQHGSLKEDCRYKSCDELEDLTLNGNCVCKEGRVRGNNGRCVWRQSESRSHAAGETTHFTQDTQSPTSNISNGANVVVSTLSPPAASSTPPTTATTTGTASPGMIVGYIVLVIVVVLLVVAVLYLVLEWRKRRNVHDIAFNGENHRLTSDEESSGTSSTSSEKQETQLSPVSNIIIINNHNFVGNKSVQYGDHNLMVPQDAAEDEEIQSPE